MTYGSFSRSAAFHWANEVKYTNESLHNSILTFNSTIDMNVTDPEDEGSTALIRAAQNQELRIAKALIETGSGS